MTHFAIFSNGKQLGSNFETMSGALMAAILLPMETSVKAISMDAPPEDEEEQEDDSDILGGYPDPVNDRFRQMGGGR